jgi:TolA-binding protein
MKSLLKLVLLAASLSLALPALGASSLSATRSAATSARQQVREVRAKQMQLRQELNQLAARIEELKGAKKSGGELDQELKRSQELSGSLTLLAQSLSSAEADAARDNLLLLQALSSELARLRGDFDRVSDRAGRKQLIVQMRVLRAEREQVRAALPAAAVPALDAPRSSDDPEDLLEQADAARDNEDKVRRELQALEVRISEAREERAFDRRLNEFLGDESIFDDQDRRFRLQKQTTETVTQGYTNNPTPTADAPAGSGAGGQGVPVGMSASAPPTQAGGVDFSNTTGGGNGRSADAASGKTAGGGSTGETSVVSRQARAADGRPTVGGQRPGVAGSEDEDLEDLEVQRARLKGLAEELKLRANQLQQRAQTLQ